jgi:uncharacterized membrane protein YukC
MGLWAWIIGSTKATDTVIETGQTLINGLVNGVDSLMLTPEEKIQYSQKAADTILEFWKQTATENSEQSKARRDLAKMSFQVFYFMIMAGVVTFPFLPKYSEFIFGVADSLTFIISSIVIIYFGPHQISKVWSNNKDLSKK